MSKVSIEGNALGSGTFTIAAPNSNTSYTLTLPENTGTVVTTGGASSLTTSGNLTFTGTGNRITGDFSNATIANRVAFQTSTTNGSTIFAILPNGTATATNINLEGDSALANGSLLSIGTGIASNTEARINATIRGTGTYLPMTFYTGGSERMRIDTSGNVGIGTSTPNRKLVVSESDGNVNARFQATSGAVRIVGYRTPENSALIEGVNVAESAYAPLGINGTQLQFYTSATERMRIDSSGNLLVGTTSSTASVGSASGQGVAISSGSFGGYVGISRNSAVPLEVQRQVDDGTLVNFFQAGTVEGSISVSGSTVTYGGGHLARWGQLLDGSKDESLKKGTVLSNLDEMCVWSAPTTYWTEEDELPEGVNVGDVKKEAYIAENEQCNKVKVSDVEGDANVAGVFVSWTYDDIHNTNDLFVAMTGDMIIRIAQGVTVQRGDLLMSAGDGTAKPQGDDIVRSKTVAKVTSTHVTCTYADGSYCVPCVLMAC
jgi:hypothetical protein